MFKKEGRKKDEKLRNMVENNSRVGEMPVFVDSLDIKGKIKRKIRFEFDVHCTHDDWGLRMECYIYYFSHNSTISQGKKLKFH